ncbi:MAG: rod shape-determining protein MreD [Prevotellaceae bacterium]|nr:rod shape-determining protein MreD [Prevotellaceae bacterium]
MMQVALKRIWQIVLLVAAQILVCNHFHIFGYATPMIYVLFLCYIPINANRIGTLCWAFVLGLLVDLFSGTPGQASASMTLAAFAQAPLLKAMAPKERPEDFTPSFRALGKGSHTVFLLVLTCIHHVSYIALEYMSFFSLLDAALSLAGSLLLSMAVMLTLETMRGRKRRQQLPTD